MAGRVGGLKSGVYVPKNFLYVVRLRLPLSRIACQFMLNNRTTYKKFLKLRLVFFELCAVVPDYSVSPCVQLLDNLVALDKP